MSDPKPQSVPMEVLVLGLCRTGTMSMELALGDLGYADVYHFSTLYHQPSHVPLWKKALEAKFPSSSGTATEIPSSLWDEILGEYSAITDIPCVCFTPEILAHYPTAKLILLTRSTSSWHKSMLSTIHALQVSPFQRLLLSLPFLSSPHIRALSSLLAQITTAYFNGDISKFGRAAYEKHNDEVRRLAREEGRPLLEMEIGDGWETLCEFLDKDIPECDFPRVNDSAAFRKDFGLDWGLVHGVFAGIVIAFLAVPLYFWMS